MYSEAWSSLFEAVEARDQKLVAAGEIHRFNRDVAESLSRIQEKYVAIPEDLGRDLNSVLGLIRRHESFETDLVALEAQLQVPTMTPWRDETYFRLRVIIVFQSSTIPIFHI